MEFAFIFLIVMITLFFVLSNKNCKVKDTTVKKEEIISEYEEDLKSLLTQYKNDKQKQIEQKKIFLRNCNSELSRNIFFTHEESVQIIQRLSRL